MKEKPDTVKMDPERNPDMESCYATKILVQILYISCLVLSVLPMLGFLPVIGPLLAVIQSLPVIGSIYINPISVSLRWIVSFLPEPYFVWVWDIIDAIIEHTFFQGVSILLRVIFCLYVSSVFVELKIWMQGKIPQKVSVSIM